MKNNNVLDGNAIIYCQGDYNTTNGKTAHGLVRYTERYRVLSVIDSRYAGQDAGMVLDNVNNNIPIYASLDEAYQKAQEQGTKAQYLVIGKAPDGGRLSEEAKNDVYHALELGLNVDCGLHDFLTEDPVMMNMAKSKGVSIRDIRKTPPREELHFFTGDIEKVNCLKLAVLGTDSAIGKRTTAWIIIHGLRKAGLKAEMIGTGQTAWLQGAKYSMIMDSTINDFVSGEIEHAVVQAFMNEHPDVIVLEGQGSLMNPAYPGGFEILAAGRPDYVILQHAPKRIEYDGFPGYMMQPLEHQIRAIEVISGKKVIAITINHENMDESEIIEASEMISKELGIPAFDVLAFSPEPLIKLIKSLI